MNQALNSIDQAKALKAAYGTLEAQDLIAAISKEFGESLTMVSSFGAESALLLHMASEVDKNMAITFLDTKKLFPETLAYRDTLAQILGLSNIRTIYPDYNDIQRADPEGDLWDRDTRGCCAIRKVLPLQRALKPYKAWITGRKRHQGGLREDLPLIEAFEGRVKINPLANWDRDKIWAEFKRRNLPTHPLFDQGYLSIGCAPAKCTSLPTDPNNPRSGRWAGEDKEECGIHLGADGKWVRSNA